MSKISHRVYFTGEVNDDSAQEVIADLYEASAASPGCDIEFVVNSRGGSIWAGTAIFSELRALSKRGGGEHYVTTKVRGVAGSIATMLVQAGDWRVQGQLDEQVWHEAMLTIDGEFLSDIRKRVENMQAWEDEYLEYLVERTGQGRGLLASLTKPWDQTFTGPQAKVLGLIDEVA